MKPKLLFQLFLLIPLLTLGQSDDFICGTPDDDDQYFETIIDAGADPLSILELYDPIVFNVSFWKVNDPNGNYIDPDGRFSENALLESIATLNTNFNKFNIFFKYRGFDEFNSPADVMQTDTYIDENGDRQCMDLQEVDPEGYGNLHVCQIGDFFDFTQNPDFENPNAINIYVPYTTSSFAGVGTPSSGKIAISLVSLSRMTWVHEMGHVLNLQHTQKLFRSDQYCERVTRNVADSIYNANDHGDAVHDTAAVPDFAREDYWDLIDAGVPPNVADTLYERHRYIDSITNEYTGAGRDCYDRLYEIYLPDTENIMSYTKSSIMSELTVGQGLKMRKTFVDFSQFYEPHTTDVAALYEPYKGEYPNYYPYPEPWQLPLFQPGFKYSFIECSGEFPQPAEYGEPFNFDYNNIISSYDVDETNYSNITHPNHTAIWLKHSFYGNDVFPQPQKCYNNWNSPPIIDGTIIKFNDNIINSNVTITHQDSTSINDAQLIEDLQPGLYNVIKNYENGDTEENVILKGGN